ncbi:MAG: HobA family DNA replication regulator [Campylobacterota bacterium]|nr:HobA family DNA replication regulator [Campylobacterota bacterium]
MNPFESWTLETIRSEGAPLSWLEELRFEWLPATQNAITQILDSKTVVLIIDKEYMWLEQYIITSINKPSLGRPLIPIVSIDALYPQYSEIIGGEMIDMFEDMLSLSYKEKYFFWYIGRGECKRSDIAKRSDKSYLWIMDESFQNAMTLHSYDKHIDIKLLQLYRLFDQSLSAVLFGETDFES